MRIDTPKKLEQWRRDCQKRQEFQKRKILVCLGPGCLANGSDKILEEFQTVLKAKK